MSMFKAGFTLCMLMASLTLHCHWYITGLEYPCQLFRQLSNVWDTYGMLSSVGFSGVDNLFVSPWLHCINLRLIMTWSNPFVFMRLNRFVSRDLRAFKFTVVLL